jgi:predicted NBD/HSP70 family sugar kinase
VQLDREAAERFHALGVKIRKDRLFGVIVDVHGNVVGQAGGHEGPAIPAMLMHDLRATDVNSVVDGVAALVGQLMALHPDFTEPVGLGVEVIGQVDRDSGVVRRSHRMGWDRPVPLAERLEEQTGHRTMVEHDVKALALAEQIWGLGQGRRSFAVVTAGIGVGAGLVIDHRLWRGQSGTAGELGHMVVEPHGQECECGNRGCLETVAGIAGILRMMQASDIDAASKLAQQGDQVALRAFGNAGKVLGHGLSWLVNLLNLELVIVRADEQLLASGVYEQAARQAFQEQGFYHAAEESELAIQPRDDWLGARSAASMVFRWLPDRVAELGDPER